LSWLQSETSATTECITYHNRLFLVQKVPPPRLLWLDIRFISPMQTTYSLVVCSIHHLEWSCVESHTTKELIFICSIFSTNWPLTSHILSLQPLPQVSQIKSTLKNGEMTWSHNRRSPDDFVVKSYQDSLPIEKSVFIQLGDFKRIEKLSLSFTSEIRFENFSFVVVTLE